MKKIVLVLIMIVAIVVLCGCTASERDNMDVEIEDRWYVNTRDTKLVSTYNDYIISSYDVEETNGGYIVTLNITLTYSKTITK